MTTEHYYIPPEEHEHVDYPHADGSLYGCPVCEAIMETERAFAELQSEYAEFTIEAWVSES